MDMPTATAALIDAGRRLDAQGYCPATSGNYSVRLDASSLLVTASAAVDTNAFETEFSLPLTQVGRVTSSRGEVALRMRGERVAKPAGYDHLSR